MRRLGVALTCILLAPGLGGLAACSSSDGTQPSTATTAPVAKEAGAAATTAAALGPGQLATFLLEGVLQGVGAQGYTFLSDLLFGSGDVTEAATTEKLDGIQSQLDQITTRLDTLDTDVKSIQGQIAGAELSDKLESMRGWNNKMTTLYTEYFRPIAAAAKDVSVAKQNLADAQKASCGTTATSTATPTSSPTCTATAVPTALADALTTKVNALEDKKAQFHTEFMQADPYTVFADQHDELFPDPNVPSVLKTFGGILESKGYATWTDSQRLRSLYLTLSDQEALSALLILEHDKMVGQDAGTQQRHRDEYVNNTAVEKLNLAPEIPWGQVKAGGQLIQIPDVRVYGPWLPISPEGTQLGTFHPDTIASTYPGWSLLSDMQITALYEATKNAPLIAGSTHLGSIWADSGYPDPDAVWQAASDWGQPTYWTKDTGASNEMVCRVHRGGAVGIERRFYTLHHVGSMVADAQSRVQAQPGVIPSLTDSTTVEGCDTIMYQQYDNATYSAHVMVTRPIDALKEDYMAQRLTAVQPAPTPSGTTTGS